MKIQIPFEISFFNFPFHEKKFIEKLLIPFKMVSITQKMKKEDNKEEKDPEKRMIIN